MSTSLDDIVVATPDGVVLPPANIRTVVEKTAGYVARNGSAFETRMRNIETNNPLFSFLDPTDAYHAFYAWRLEEIRAGRGTDVSAGRTGAGSGTGASSAAPVLGNGIASLRANREKKKQVEPPAEFEFSAPMPRMSAQDVDIVKLTAQFAARNGRGWTTALAQREARNFQFDFLHPSHSLHPFFNKLVEQYLKIITVDQPDTTADTNTVSGPPTNSRAARLARLEADATTRLAVLPRARHRAEWSKQQAAQQQKKEAADEKERLQFLQIDWHDFVVVETIVFTAEDEGPNPALGPPTSLVELQTASLEQRELMSIGPNRRIEEAMPTADMADLIDLAASSLPGTATSAFTPAQAVASSMTPASTSTTSTPVMPGHIGPMKIRADYVPQPQVRRPEQKTALCPRCKQQIDLAEWDQHMRVELLDPDWRAQKAAEAARQGVNSTTAAYASIDIANNLKRMAASSSTSSVPSPSTATASPTVPLPPGPASFPQLGVQSQQSNTGSDFHRQKIARSGAASDISGGFVHLPPPPPGVQLPAMPLVPGISSPDGQEGNTMQGMTIEDQIKRLHERYKGA